MPKHYTDPIDDSPEALTYALMQDAAGLLQEARHHETSAMLHLNIYNQHVPTGIEDEEDPRWDERFSLDIMLKCHPAMESLFTHASETYFPDSPETQLPHTKEMPSETNAMEQKHTNLRSARQRIGSMHEKLREYLGIVRQLRALNEVPYEMEKNAVKLERYGEFWTKKAVRQIDLYGNI